MSYMTIDSNDLSVALAQGSILGIKAYSKTYGKDSFMSLNVMV